MLFFRFFLIVFCLERIMIERGINFRWLEIWFRSVFMGKFFFVCRLNKFIDRINICEY